MMGETNPDRYDGSWNRWGQLIRTAEKAAAFIGSVSDSNLSLGGQPGGGLNSGSFSRLPIDRSGRFGCIRQCRNLETQLLA